MVVRQGDIWWIDLGEPSGSAPGYRHPHVVVQNNVFNASKIRTVLVCPLTTNLKRTRAPGNVLLNRGEAKLRRPSVVNVSQVIAVDRADLIEHIGRLSGSRVRQIVQGIALLIEPREIDLQ
jgi:mRNA interferase MazF